MSPEDNASLLHPQCGLLYFRVEGESSCCHSLIITPPAYNSWFSRSCCSPHNPTPHKPPHPLKTLFPVHCFSPHFNSCNFLWFQHPQKSPIAQLASQFIDTPIILNFSDSFIFTLLDTPWILSFPNTLSLWKLNIKQNFSLSVHAL